MALGYTVQEIIELGEFSLLVKHESWERLQLDNVALVQNGYAFSSDKFTKGIGMPLIRIRDIGNNFTQDFYQGDYPKEFEVEKGDILIGMDGDFNLSIWKGEKGLLNQRVCRLKLLTDNYSEKFLIYTLPAFLKAINTKTSSVTVKHLSSRTIGDIPLPLPPLAEQQRIVAKIEELFSELDKGIESLKTAQQQLKVYRQSVLKYAFEGELTKEKRENGRYADSNKFKEELNAIRAKSNIKLKFSEIVENDDLPQKPKEWIWMRNESLLKYVTSGSRDWKKYYSNRGSVFIRTQDIKTNFLELTDAAYVNLPHKVEGKRSLVEPGDILMTITGANVGKVAVIPENIPEAYVSQSVALMKLLDNRLSKYLWYYFQSRTYGEGLVGGLVYGVGRPVLSLENMREVPVAICTVEEQCDIVEEIESRLSVCDKIEESIEQGLQRAEALRQSILKKAFEGKLVPQDPNDEPASVLLERIKAERAAAQPEKKTKTKKVKA